MTFHTPDPPRPPGPRDWRAYGRASIEEEVAYRTPNDALVNWLELRDLDESIGRELLGPWKAIAGEGPVHAMVYLGLQNSQVEEWHRCAYMLEQIDHPGRLLLALEESSISEETRAIGNCCALGRVDLANAIWPFTDGRSLQPWRLVGRILHEQTASALPVVVAGLYAMGHTDDTIARGIADAATWHLGAEKLDLATQLAQMPLLQALRGVVSQAIADRGPSIPRPDRPADHLVRVLQRLEIALKPMPAMPVMAAP